MNGNGFNNDFGGPGGGRNHRDRGFNGPFGILGFAFSMVGLGLTLAFNVVNIVLQVITGVANSRAEQHRMQGRQMPPRQAEAPRPQQQAARPQQAPKANAKQTPNVSKDQVKQTLKQQNHESTSDWNILLFVLTLIPLIVSLAAKRLDLAGMIGAGGLSVIVIYNIFRTARIKSKQKRKLKEETIVEKKMEDTELDRVVKEAFEKVYAIRKDLIKIKNPEIAERLEKLCDLAEKIIGEVRTNPDSLNSVRKFFYYYLDAFTEVFTKYLKLNNFSQDSEEVQKLLMETEKSFQDMEGIFQEMCEGMLEKDMLNLKATINVLKNSNYSNQ